MQPRSAGTRPTYPPCKVNPLLYLTILFLIMGIQFIGMGFVGELTMRTYHETQKKPTYVVRKVLGGEPVDVLTQ